MDTANSASNYPVQFTGSGKGYFSVWLVNVILTLCSFGALLPWAIIRSQKYYYAHTLVNQQSLASRASVWRLLAGYLLTAGLMFFLVTAVSSLHQDVLRLDAPHIHQHTEQQDLNAEGHQHFKWHPDISDGEKDYLENGHKHADPAQVIKAQFEDKSTAIFNLLLLLLLIAIVVPLLDYALNHYFVTHTQLGAKVLSLHASLISLLGVYFKFYVLALFSLIALLVFAFFMAAVLSSIMSPELASSSLHNVGVVFWLLVLLSVMTSVWLFACLNKWRLQWCVYGIKNGDRGLSSDHTFWPLFKVYCLNTFSIIITLGIATPWALVRSYRYKIAKLECSGS